MSCLESFLFADKNRVAFIPLSNTDIPLPVIYALTLQRLTSHNISPITILTLSLNTM